jgi:hypothetical protein
VVAYARKQYGCDSLTRFKMEDNGDEGSKSTHWEKSWIFNEIMSAELTSNQTYFSRLTLSLFEDMGWYIPIYENA